jgi:hypothetical protein
VTHPSSAVSGTEMRRSAAQTCANSLALIVQAQASVAAATALCGDAAGLRTQARAIRSRRTEPSPMCSHRVRSFSLEGVIEDRTVHAEWRDGRLMADPLLLERAQLVVGLEDQFLSPDASPLTASLNGLPIVALLTLMRACDRVRQIDVVGPAGKPGGALTEP